MRRRRLPRPIEKELAKFLGTIGFKDYSGLLWDLPPAKEQTEEPAPLSANVCRQILDQARHEPAIVAVGEASLPNLRRETQNLETSRGVSSTALLADTGPRPDVLLIAARLDPSTIETLIKFVTILRTRGARSFLVIVSDEGKSARSASSLSALADTRLIFWPDRFTGDARSGPRHLALLIHVLGAATVISLRSRLGLETIGWYGRALKSFHRLHALLDVPANAPFTDIYYLRLTAPHATILAVSDASAAALRAAGTGLGGLQVAALGNEAAGTIIGDVFEDRRSPASRTAIARLLGEAREPRIEIAAAPSATNDRVDLTVTIVFHGERELAVPALASLRDMVEAARRDGIGVESCAMLDKADDATRRLVREHGSFLDDIREVAFGDLGSVRNAGAEIARGRFLAFVDGDDLWGADWLARAYRDAARSDDPLRTVWHPETLLAFWASDCDRTSGTPVPHEGVLTGVSIQQSGDAAGFDSRDLLFENMWSANCFAARELHLRFPYRPDDWSRQIGIEDWRFNLETLGHGINHFVVPDTVHLIRMKEGGSLGQAHETKASLPLLD